MAKYKVRPGFTHGAQKQYKAGDIVELSEEEAAGFLDKLELVRGKQAKAADESEGADSDWRTAIQNASPQEIADALGVDADALMQLREGKGATKPAGLVVNPVPSDAPATRAEATKDVEQELEAETGKDFQPTGGDLPTLVETNKPAGVPRGKSR